MPGFYATIARYYDSEHSDKDEDLPLYEELADEAGGPVLIVGSGTGRLALDLAEEGHAVTGIEIEPEMMALAQAKLADQPELKARVTLIEGDALRVSLKGAFGLAIIPYNTLMHFLDQDSQIALLKRIHDWLKPGGLLVIDLPNAGDAFGSLDLEAVMLERSFLEQETGHLVMQQSVSRLDRAEQIMQITWIYDEITGDGTLKRTVVPVNVRYFFAGEMRLLLELTGFTLEDLYGDFDRPPFEDGSPRMIVLGRR